MKLWRLWLQLWLLRLWQTVVEWQQKWWWKEEECHWLHPIADCSAGSSINQLLLLLLLFTVYSLLLLLWPAVAVAVKKQRAQRQRQRPRQRQRQQWQRETHYHHSKCATVCCHSLSTTPPPLTPTALGTALCPSTHCELCTATTIGLCLSLCNAEW